MRVQGGGGGGGGGEEEEGGTTINPDNAIVRVKGVQSEVPRYETIQSLCAEEDLLVLPKLRGCVRGKPVKKFLKKDGATMTLKNNINSKYAVKKKPQPMASQRPSEVSLRMPRSRLRIWRF